MGHDPQQIRQPQTTVDGITFDSAAEARRWRVLRIMERGKLISGLQRQVPLALEVNGVKVGTYKADFTYTDATGKHVVEDVKGVATPAYKLKKKLLAALYGVEITEVQP